MRNNSESISNVQQQILTVIKQEGETTNAIIAQRLSVSYEAVRQQLRQLEAAQLITSRKDQPDTQQAGRPTRAYTLSATGEHLFTKGYDELAIVLIDTLATALDADALAQVLASLTDKNVSQWTPYLQDKSLPEQVEKLKGIYLEDDAYMDVRQDEASGDFLLVERNCPYLNVALRRPTLCSVTSSTLSRLLGHVVTREKRFQDGDGCCVFRVHLDQPINSATFRFAFEEGMNSSQQGV